MKYLLALLIFHKHNIHMLHWNLCGSEFEANHKAMGDIYSEMEEHIDEVAEMLIQEGGFPLNYKDVLDMLSEDSMDHAYTDPKTLYSGETAYRLAIAMLNEIIEAINNCYEDSSIPRAHQSNLETIQSWYMLKAKYLLARRLVTDYVK